MAKDVRFNIKLMIDGQQHVVEASTGVKELAKQLGIVKDKSRSLSDVLIQFNQAAEITDRISGAMVGLADRMRDTVRVNAQVTQLTGLTGEEMTKLRNSVQAVSDYFSTDFNATLQSANTLSKAFGISAQEAFRLVRDGLVSGANANGDFISTLTEYPRYFKEAGISAEGFVAIATNAARQGIFSDKGVDAVKEANIRIREMTKATRDALEGIGISSEAVMEALQSGSMTTFDVMQMVSARLAELPASSAAVGTAIADIFGGPGEDAGLEYIKTLADVELSMAKVKEAAGETAEQQEAVIRSQERMRNFLADIIDLSGLYASMQPWLEIAAQAGMAFSGIASLIGALKAVNAQYAVYRIRTAAANLVTRLFGTNTRAAAASTQMLGTATGVAAARVTALRIALRAAFVTSGIGLAVLAVTEAVNYLASRSEDAAQAVDRLKESEEDYKQAAGQARTEMDRSIKELEKVIATRQDDAETVRRLNETYGEAFGTYRTAAQWYDTLTQKGMAYIRMKGYEAQAVRLASQIAERQSALDLNTDRQEELIGQGVATVTRRVPVTTVGAAGQRVLTFEDRVEDSRAMRREKEEAKALNSEIAGLEAQYAKVTERLEEFRRTLGQPTRFTAGGVRNEAADSGGGNKDPEKDLPAGLMDDIRRSVEETVVANIRLGDPGEEAQAYVERLRDRLAEAQEKMETAPTVEAKIEAAADVMRIQAEIDEATRGRLSIQAAVTPSYITAGSREDKRQSYANAEDKAAQVRRDYEIGLVNKDEALRELERINEEIDKLGLKKIVIDLDAAPLKKEGNELSGLAGTINAISGAMGSLGDAVGEGAGQWLQWSSNLLSSVQSAITAITQLIAVRNAETTANTAAAASGAASSVASIPIVGAVLAVAAVASVVAALSSLPKFAKGGIAYGPTLGLFGEYAGAANNPEVVAPLDRLRSLMRPAGVDFGKVEFVIHERTLRGILNKGTNISRRS